MIRPQDVTIGIVARSDPARLRATIETLRRHTPPGSRWVLIPDAPSPDLARTLARLTEFPQLPANEPGGGAACFNRLAAFDDALVILLLESGTLVGPRWLEFLLAALAAHPAHGLAGPSTNRCWNEQRVPHADASSPETLLQDAAAIARRFGLQTRPLTPLHSLADFCYAVRRDVLAAIGPADEAYRRGPCWEMDYNIRAARAGWRGVWACGAYVHRLPPDSRQVAEESLAFQASKERYQDKFCGARLRGEKSDYRPHCRGDACPNFAPPALIRIVQPWSTHDVAAGIPPAVEPGVPPGGSPPGSQLEAGISFRDERPRISCIMPTFNRPQFARFAIERFLRQTVTDAELVIVDDGTLPVRDVLPAHPRLRLIELPRRLNTGAKRNAACANARGEIIVHWDDDDWYPDDRLARQLAAFHDPRIQITGTSTLYYHDADAASTWRYVYTTSARPWIAGNTLAYRRSWWQSHPFPEVQVGEDNRFVSATPPRGIADLADPGLCVARIHPHNTSPKRPRGTAWIPCDTECPRALIGADWEAFTALPPGDPSPRSHSSSGLLPLVSCIMPTRNRRAFVELALQGFHRQNYPNAELVIVDDGDDDLADLAANRPRVRYVKLPHEATIGRKRQIACEAARGELIAHWDDDDWYAPGRLSHQVAPIVEGKADLTGLENAFSLDLPTGRCWRVSPDLHARMFVGNVHGGTLVFRRSILGCGVRYPDRNLAEDAILLRQALQAGHRLVRLSNPGLFVYVRHGANAWRFPVGSFLDSKGWHVTSPPREFLDWLPHYQRCLPAVREPSAVLVP